MRAYSIDLREKIIKLSEEGKISQRKLAKQFDVALSFIEKLIKQYRQTGSVEPKKRTVQTPTKLNYEQLEILEKLAEENNDATLDELSQMLHKHTGVMISRVTVDRMLKKLNITFKKNVASNRKRERKSPATAI
jgi:transposase